MKPSSSHRFSWLACSVLVCLSPLFLGASKRQQSPASARTLPNATTRKYFPQGSVQGLMVYIAEFLNFTDEPSLLPSAQGRDAVSYRFEAWLMPGTNVRVIRFSLHPDRTATVIMFLGPYPKDPSAKVKPNKVERNVSAEDAARFLQLVDGAGFWTMPTVEPGSPTPPQYYVLDGAFWLFEGVRAGAYHVVCRPNPNASLFTDMVHFLAKDLAQLNESEIPRGLPTPSQETGAGVTIGIDSAKHVVGDVLTIHLVNHSSDVISYCGSPGSYPFFVEERHRFRWRTLSYSHPDNDNRPESLDPGATRNFRRGLSGPGTYRLRLAYINGPRPGSCTYFYDVPHMKQIRSKPYVVVGNLKQ